MAWFKCGGGGIPAALKSLMNSVFNKKFGTAEIYPPETWPDTVNLMGPLEEKTVSGSIVAFSDGADDVPLKSCAVTIAPTLTGVSSVDVVHTGKNLFNLIPYLATAQNTPTFSDCMYVKGGQYTFSFDKLTDGVNEATSWRFVVTVYNTSGTIITDWTLSSGLTYRSTLQSYAGGANSTNKNTTFTLQDNCYIFVRFWSGDTTASMTMTKTMLELGNTASTFEPYNGTTHTATLGRTIYGGSVDVVNGTGTDENGNDFTFTPVPILSRLGDNTMWGDGDLSVVYRSSGTQTLIPPTLISKTITENGTYSAEDDGADGYSSVVVDVPTGATNIETVLGSSPLIEVTGVSGTDVTRTMWTRTAAAAETVVFHPNTQVKTNTGSNDGYFKVLKNSEVIVSTYANTSTTTALVIPDIELEAGDILTIVGGFDNSHTSCLFDLYSTITILSSGSAPVLGLGLGNPGPVNESEQEEPDAAPEEIQEETPEEVDQNESDE